MVFFTASCDRIKCPSGMNCLLDQNLIPHCVNCTKKCNSHPKKREVCGADGLTYPSACHLREKTCRKGKATPIAYKGPCRGMCSLGRIWFGRLNYLLFCYYTSSSSYSFNCFLFQLRRTFLVSLFLNFFLLPSILLLTQKFFRWLVFLASTT